MNVGHSVTKSIDDWEIGDFDAAMLHACNAVDGTAKKAFPQIIGSNLRFTSFLRDNYLTLGVMGMPGINLEESRFAVTVAKPKASGGKPDLADIIYGIHRCAHGHGEALPDGFELVPDAAGTPGLTRFCAEPGRIRLSDRIIFGLLATVVFAPVNSDQLTPEGYYLTLEDNHKFIINEYWGRRDDFERIAAGIILPSVKLDFGKW